MKRLLARISCLFGYHDLRIVQQLSQYCQKLHCERCERYYAINHHERVFLRWSGEFEAFYCRLLKIERTAR